MTHPRYLLIAMLLALPFGTSARAEDLNCVIGALAFDVNLNPLAELRTSSGIVSGRNAAKACGKNRTIGIEAAQSACRDNAGARFVAVFHRVEGVDLVKSSNSRAKFNEEKPESENASIKLKSCAFWAAQGLGAS